MYNSKETSRSEMRIQVECWSPVCSRVVSSHFILLIRRRVIDLLQFAYTVRMVLLLQCLYCRTANLGSSTLQVSSSVMLTPSYKSNNEKLSMLLV